MYLRNMYRGAAVWVAISGFMPAVQAAVDPGFTVSGVTVSTSSGFMGGAGTDNAVSSSAYEWYSSDGEPKKEVEEPKPGVPGKVEFVQYYKDYKQVDWRDSYLYTNLQSSDDDFRAGNWVSLSGVVTVNPQSVFYDRYLLISVGLDGQYQNAGTTPPQLSGALDCCAPAAPSYFLKLGGSNWQSLPSSTTFYPDDDGSIVGEGDGYFTSSSYKEILSNQFSFEVLVHVGAHTNIDNFSLLVSSYLYGDTELIGTRREVLGSHELPALPVSEPSQLALVLAGGTMVAGLARRRRAAKLTH